MRAVRERIRLLLVPSGDGSLVGEAPPVAIREIFRRFWPAARPYRRWIPLGLAFIAAGAALETAEIWLFKLVVDDVLVPGDLGPLLSIGLLYLALAVSNALVSFGDDYLATWLAERFLQRLRRRVFSHVQRLSLDVLDRRRLGDVTARLTADVQAIESFVVSGVADGLSAVLRIVFFSGALFYLQWQLALVALIVTPLFLVAARRFARLIKHASREKRRRSGSLSAAAQESLGNQALVQASNREQAELERFERENEGIIQAELAATRIRGLFSPVVDLIELAGVMLVLVLGTVAVADGSLTLGGLLVFIAYLTQLYGPMRDLSSLSNTIFKAAAGAERVIELLDERPRIVDKPDAVRLERARGAVELQAVSFTYPGAGRRALADVSLRAEPGETLALVGASGAGKSTIAKLLPRFYDPDGGAVRLDGHDLRDLEVASLRQNVAILLQETLVLHGTVRENISYARHGASDEEIRRAAVAAGADEFVRALPEGYDTDLGERGRRLSGGQRQRVAIARALVANAPVLILDEPSTGLDAEARAALVDPLRRLMAGRTTIVISHDLLTVRDADRIVVLDDGHVVESGGHSALVAAGGAYAKLWALHGTTEEEKAVTSREGVVR
ncbi:MAG: ABC transporter ATP-binding protein [Thermoleophilaceae bacterium]